MFLTPRSWVRPLSGSAHCDFFPRVFVPFARCCSGLLSPLSGVARFSSCFGLPLFFLGFFVGWVFCFFGGGLVVGVTDEPVARRSRILLLLCGSPLCSPPPCCLFFLSPTTARCVSVQCANRSFFLKLDQIFPQPGRPFPDSI